MVLQKFVNKTNDPSDDSFDLNTIIRHLTSGAGLQDIAAGKSAGGENDTDDGGIMGKIKGMFN